ncbi:MAG: metal-sensing transcriptional repressor [Blautia sp.]|nr:metal-sensing transcriptional repressor [Blautia sp.]
MDISSKKNEAGISHFHTDPAERHSHSHPDETEGHIHSHPDQSGGHTHSHPHDTHFHPDGQSAHNHTHTHKNTKAVLDRLARAIGHLEKVRSMVEEGYDCSEVLIQLSAVKSAINNTGKIILKDHIEHCIVDAIANGDYESIRELSRAIDQFVK